MKNSLKKACLHHLQNTFGLDGYRPGQKEAVQAILSGRDVLCILPTGAGKSLCWQLPAVVQGGVTLIISPLIALMRDQVQHLESVGISAVSLDSLMTQQEKEWAVQRIRKGETRIVFVSPERLQNPLFQNLCRELQPWLIVVDEAHCAVQWGESFRPAYSLIGEFLMSLPQRPVVCAMTATADRKMQHGICRQLRMHPIKRVTLPVIRDNLIYEVHTTLNRTGEILHLLQEKPGKAVIFCRSRVRTEALSRLLISYGLEAAFYHAGMEREERVGLQHAFMAGQVRVLCATSAFGLGVDIPDIRLVVHDYLPDNLIDYVQQSGRAGRDGNDAWCVLFLEPNELVRQTALERKAKEKYQGNAIERHLILRKKQREIRRVINVLMASDCIPSAAAKAFGHRCGRCGQCSACRRGRLIRKTISFAGRKPWHIRAWILVWQRNALAKKLHLPPRKILPDSAVMMAAKWYAVPKAAPSHPEIQRLLAHFRRDAMHEKG